MDFGVMEGAPNRRVVPTFGKRCCIIDFTFSRLAIGGDDKLVAVAADNAASIFYRPYDDEAFFEGEGDYQFDIYRDMRDVMREGVETTQTASDAIDWSGFRPKTNVLWLHYLVDKLLDGVAYKKKPKGTRGRVSTSSSKKLLVDLRKRLLSYDSARHFVAEDPVFVALAEMVPLPKGDERE